MWALPSDLFRLSELMGFSINFKGVYCSALAAKGRVYCCEPYPFDAKASELDSLQYSPNSPTDQPFKWQAWYHSSFVRVVCRAAQQCSALGAPPKTLFRQLRAERAEEEPLVAKLKAKKKLQKTIYDSLLKGKLYTPLHDRVRHKIERWCFDSDTPGQVARRIVHQMPRLGKLVAPRVLSAVIRTLYNGWCTARRFQSSGCCCLGCPYEGTDSIEHYARCRHTNALRSQLQLPDRFFSVLGFMGGL